jgi:hypothetical protein
MKNCDSKLLLATLFAYYTTDIAPVSTPENAKSEKRSVTPQQAFADNIG